jgi:DNA-binding response OmpR family regulator
MHTILIVDDETILLETIAYNLEQTGYHVSTATTSTGALEVIRGTVPDLIILDVMLPEMDGLERCRLFRRQSQTAKTPILFLSARAEEIDKVIGLEIGADDYLTKPFGRHELLARVRALLRRADTVTLSTVATSTQEVRPKELVAGPLRIDFAGRRVFFRSEALNLQPKQFDLLTYLVRNRGTVLTRAQLLHSVWGYDYEGDTRTVDVHIRWLRERFEEDASNPQLIQTVRGVGYVIRW